MLTIKLNNTSSNGVQFYIEEVAGGVVDIGYANVPGSSCSPDIHITEFSEGEQVSFVLIVSQHNGEGLGVDVNFDQDGARCNIYQRMEPDENTSAGGLYISVGRDNVFTVYETYNAQPNPAPQLFGEGGREPTAEEWDGLARLFPLPGLNNDGIVVYGDVTDTYNCVAWAVGITAVVIPDPMPASETMAIDDVVRILGPNAVRCESVDSPEANVIFWGDDSGVRHVIACRMFDSGPRWSSKLGWALNPNNKAESLLVAHPRNAWVEAHRRCPFGSPIAAFTVPTWPTHYVDPTE